MKYNRLGYLVGEGFSNVFKNKKSTGASLMIMCATMIIFGIFLILGENINHFVSEVESAQGIQVFVNNDATQEQIDELGEKLRKLDGVSISKFEQKFGENPIYLFRNELQKLVEEDLIEVDLDDIKLTKKGLDLANLVWEEFI